MTKLLGMILVDSGEITTTQLAEALNYQELNGGVIGKIFIELGFIDQATLQIYLEKQDNRTHKE